MYFVQLKIKIIHIMSLYLYYIYFIEDTYYLHIVQFICKVSETQYCFVIKNNNCRVNLGWYIIILYSLHLFLKMLYNSL